MSLLYAVRTPPPSRLNWSWDRLSARDGEPAGRDLGVTVPRCGAALTLPEPRSGAPVGFARFDVSAMNWARVA